MIHDKNDVDDMISSFLNKDPLYFGLTTRQQH